MQSPLRNQHFRNKEEINKWIEEMDRSTTKHKKNMEFKKDELIQQFLNVPRNDFTKNVLRAFFSADIPLWKLRNKELLELFQSIGHPLPSDQTCRLKIPQLFEEERAKIKDIVQDKPVFLIIDETDNSGTKYVNLLVGILEKPQSAYIYDCIPLITSTNSLIITRIVDDAIVSLGISRQNFNLLLSDSATYMMAAGNILHQLYPNLFHATCIAHLIHNCVMKVKTFYNNVDVLIANVKNAIVKNKSRKNDFVSVGIPPDPVVTRLGSWLNAALYYCKNLPEVQRIVLQWQGNGVIVTQTKKAVQNPTVIQSLIDIQECYSTLSSLILKLENTECSIIDAYSYLNELDFGTDACNLKMYLKNRMEKNEIVDIINTTMPDVSPYLYALLKHCQCTSATVERSFSMLKKLLTKERHFKPENIKQYLIVYYNCSANRPS